MHNLEIHAFRWWVFDFSFQQSEIIFYARLHSRNHSFQLLVIEGVTDNGTDVWPVLVLSQKDPPVIGVPRMLVKVKLPKFFWVETHLLYQLCITNDQKRFTSDICKICLLVRVLLDHLLHETLRVTIFFDVFPLNSQHARERGNIDLKRGIHFFEPPGSDIDFEDEMVDEKGEEK